MNETNERMRLLRQEIEACDYMANFYTTRKEELKKELKEMVDNASETCY